MDFELLSQVDEFAVGKLPGESLPGVRMLLPLHRTPRNLRLLVRHAIRQLVAHENKLGRENFHTASAAERRKHA